MSTSLELVTIQEKTKQLIADLAQCARVADEIKDRVILLANDNDEEETLAYLLMFGSFLGVVQGVDVAGTTSHNALKSAEAYDRHLRRGMRWLGIEAVTNADGSEGPHRTVAAAHDMNNAMHLICAAIERKVADRSVKMRIDSGDVNIGIVGRVLNPDGTTSDFHLMDKENYHGSFL